MDETEKIPVERHETPTATVGNERSRDAANEIRPREKRQSWCYDQQRSRNETWHCTGHIELIHGASAERLRSKLARASADLLRWAADAATVDPTKDA